MLSYSGCFTRTTQIGHQLSDRFFYIDVVVVQVIDRKYNIVVVVMSIDVVCVVFDFGLKFYVPNPIVTNICC
jgi:hypothetical protein